MLESDDPQPLFPPQIAAVADAFDATPRTAGPIASAAWCDMVDPLSTWRIGCEVMVRIYSSML